MMNRNGTIRQPTRNGTRQPHSPISLGDSWNDSSTPSSAANITATCWLADCQLTKKPLRPGVEISAR